MSPIVLCLALALNATPTAPGPEAVIAVFEIEDATGRLTAAELDQLTTYLTASLAKTKVYEVVPRASLREALRAEQAESFKACYDEACQIEIGRELAAQKALVTRIVQVGTACAVTSTLIDLTRATSERAATFKADCSADAVVDGLEGVVKELTDRGVPPPVVADVAPPPPPPLPVANPGRLELTSEPSGAEVRIDGQFAGKTPLEVPIKGLGIRQVVIEQRGFSPWTVQVRSGPGERARLHAQLVDLALQTEAKEASESAGTGVRWLSVGAVAAALGGGLLVALAPSERSIREGEYEQYLSSQLDPNAYTAVEDRVTVHNQFMVGGWSLVGAGAAMGVGAFLWWLADEEVPSSAGTVEIGAIEVTP